MANYLYLIQNDPQSQSPPIEVHVWETYIDQLRTAGHFVGGGSLGEGCLRTSDSTTAEISQQINGYMVITAESLQQATELAKDSPILKAGGSLEIRHIT